MYEGGTPVGAVKKQCTGSAGKTMSRITRSSPRERTACSSSKRSHDSDIRPSVLLADLRHIRPLAADELDNAAAHRLLRILDVVVSDASSIHDYSQSGVSLAWCLASVRLKENHGQSHEFSNLCNSFTRFLSEYIYHPLGTKEGVCPSRYQDLFLWLSASVTIRKAFADYEHADFIIKKLFSCLSGVHKNVTVVATVVSCLVLMLDHHRSAAGVLTETNTLQFLRLFMTRAVHADCAGQDGSMVDEAITGRTALLQLLQSPQVLPRHTDAVGKELSSFVAKWWNRLDAYSTADSPSLTEHTAITAVSILADVAAVAPFHDQLRHHIMTKEGIGVICRLMQSEQKRLALAAAQIAARLNIIDKGADHDLMELLDTQALALLHRAVSSLTPPLTKQRTPLSEITLTGNMQNRLATVTTMSPSDINVEASIAADILMIDCSLALLKASLSSEGLVSTSPVVRQWKDVAMAVRLTAKDVMASYSYKQETSSSRAIMSNSVFILRRICEVDAFVAASIITELKAIEGIIDFGAEIFDSYTSDWLQQMLTSTVSAAMTPQPIAAVDAIDETTFILSSNNSPQNSFLSREEVVQSQLWTSPPGTGCSCREDNPLVELTCASPLARSSNLASAIISSSALEEWIDQDTQAFFPESPEIDNGARSDDYNCRRMLNSEDCAAVFDAEVIALAVEEDVDSVALKDENRDLKDQLSQQQAIVSSLIVKLSKFEEAATNATADAARLRGDLAAMMVSRDSAVDASNRQKLIIEESWQKLSILAKRIETTEEDAKMARAQCAVAVEHSTLVEHRLLLSEATAAEAKSLADGTLTRVSEIISENRRLIDSKRKLENSLREMNLKFSECKVEQQRSEVLLEAKSSKIEDLLEKVSHLVKDQTELTNTNKCLEFDLLTAQNTVEELIGQVASKESRILALEEDLRRERVQLEQGKQTISAKEQQLSEHLEKLNVANNKLAVSMALVDETNNRLAASLVRAEEKEAELVMARADISKHKEIIMYINKLSAESSAAK